MSGNRFSGNGRRYSRGRPVIAASCRLRQGHPWHGLPPRLCLVRGEWIDAGPAGITRCYGDGDVWVVELMLPEDSIEIATFELELLADSAAYVRDVRR